MVTVSDLTRYLWGDTPPATARTALQNYVMRLRRALGETGEGSPLSTHQEGYMIQANAEELDLLRFDELIAQANLAMATEGPQQASVLLREALALWRGQPLADVPSEDLQREVVPYRVTG